MKVDGMKYKKDNSANHAFSHNIIDFYFLIFNEIKLLSRSRFISISVLVTAVAMVIGLNSLDYSNSSGLQNIAKTSFTLILAPSKYGAIAGSLLFSLTTLELLSRDRKQEAFSLLESSIGYRFISLTKTASIIFFGIIAVLLGSILVFVVQVFILGVPFNAELAAITFILIPVMAIIFTVLICAGLYMLTESMDASFLIYLGLLFMSLTSPSYLLNWVQTHALIYSDFGGVNPVIQLVFHSRILWLGISFFIFTSGLLVKRKNGLSIINSFNDNIKNKAILILFILTLFFTTSIYAHEPYISREDSGFADDVKIDKKIKLSLINPDVVLLPANEELSASVLYEFEIIDDVNLEYVDFIRNCGLEIDSVMVNGLQSKWDYIENTNRIRVKLPDNSFNKLENQDLIIEMKYSGKLKNPSGNSFSGYISEKSIYLLENSHWIFEPLTGKKDNIDIQGSIQASKELTVITPGKTTDVKNNSHGKTWLFSLISPVSDIAVFAGEYELKNIEAGDTEVEFYFNPEHADYIHEMDIEYRIKDIISFYQNNIGSYSFDYPMKIVETPIYKSGGHSTQNVVTVAEYVFNREADITLNNDTTIRPDRIESLIFVNDMTLLSHEIAHQWWGSGVIVEGISPWSSEGFAEYLSYKYIQGSFEYWASDYILRGWERAYLQQKQSYYAQNPENLEKLPDYIRNKKKANIRKTELYAEMPLKFVKAEEILGEDRFLEAIGESYNTHRQNKLTYNEFLEICNLSKEELGYE